MPRRTPARFEANASYTEYVQLKLNYCVARTHLPAKPSWSTTSATAPRSAVKATRNALGLPDDFTGTVAGGDLAIFRANGAEICKSAVIKRLQRALKRAGFDPDLHSGTACAKAERRISSMPASSCNISCAGGRGPKAAPHCAFTAMSLLLRAGWSKRTAHGARTGPRVESNVLDFDQVKVAGTS